MTGTEQFREIMRPAVSRNRVLLVDADEKFSSMLAARLNSSGYSVTRARNAEEASIFGKVDWDVVITDWALPGLQGRALVDKLRPFDRPVIVWSDHPDASPLKGMPGTRAYFRRSQRVVMEQEIRKVLTPSEQKAGEVFVSTPSFLITEDSETIRRFIKHVLVERYPDSEIHEAEDGRAAIRVMKENRVSLIFTDLQMPGMDGEDFVELLSRNPLLKKKPVIVFSGAITPEVKEKMLGRDRLRLVAKPASPDTIDEAVKSLLAETC